MAKVFSNNARWRDSARYPKLWIFDARAIFPFMLFLMHIRLWTFIVALLAMVFFSLLARYGFTVPVFFRLVRSTLAGKRKMANPWWR